MSQQFSKESCTIPCESYATCACLEKVEVVNSSNESPPMASLISRMTSKSTGNMQLRPPHSSNKLKASFRETPDGPAFLASLRILAPLRNCINESSSRRRTFAHSHLESSLGISMKDVSIRLVNECLQLTIEEDRGDCKHLPQCPYYNSELRCLQSRAAVVARSVRLRHCEHCEETHVPVTHYHHNQGEIFP